MQGARSQLVWGWTSVEKVSVGRASVPFDLWTVTLQAFACPLSRSNRVGLVVSGQACPVTGSLFRETEGELGADLVPPP